MISLELCEISLVFREIKTTYCFHKPTFLKFKKSVNEHCFKDN